MKIINTDGMSFIGPGSEWFWTALSGIVLAVTFLTIYRQLRIARSASAREQLESTGREWTSETVRALFSLEVLLARRDSLDPASIPSSAALVEITGLWDDTAALVRGGHLRSEAAPHV